MISQSRSNPYFGSKDFCSVELKWKFDFRTAVAVARSIRRQHESNHGPYRCDSCRAWHVGSSELGHPPLKPPRPKVVRLWDLEEAA